MQLREDSREIAQKDRVTDFVGIALTVVGVVILALERRGHGIREIAIFAPVLLQVIIMTAQRLWRRTIYLTVNGTTFAASMGKLKEGEARNIVQALRK